MPTFKTKSTLALAVLMLGSCLFAGQATAAGAGTQRGRPSAAHDTGLVKHGDRLIRPLYSELCQYKGVMNEEDMRRCGIVPRADPEAHMTYIDLRTARTYR
jgi:hypothetical protein